MFDEILNRPMTFDEYERAEQKAEIKLKRIREREPNAGERYSKEYFKQLLREQLLQDRMEEATISKYKGVDYNV